MKWHLLIEHNYIISCYLLPNWLLPNFSRNVSFSVIFWSHLLPSDVGHIVGYASNPSVSDANAPDTVIGDIQKFKEMKGFVFMLS